MYYSFASSDKDRYKGAACFNFAASENSRLIAAPRSAIHFKMRRLISLASTVIMSLALSINGQNLGGTYAHFI